jgi:flagellar biosynthesis GTPase FlhF
MNIQKSTPVIAPLIDLRGNRRLPQNIDSKFSPEGEEVIGGKRCCFNSAYCYGTPHFKVDKGDKVSKHHTTQCGKKEGRLARRTERERTRPERERKQAEKAERKVERERKKAEKFKSAERVVDSDDEAPARGRGEPVMPRQIGSGGLSKAKLRGLAVKRIMKEEGVKLGEASKILAERTRKHGAGWFDDFTSGLGSLVSSVAPILPFVL